MKKTIYICTLLLGSLSMLVAQEDESIMEKLNLDLSGSVDTYFRANFDGEFDSAPGTSFANLPGFGLGMANLIVAQEGPNFGFTADLVFGPRGEDATFLSPLLRPGGNSSIVNQLYAYWTVNETLTFTLGNFNTFLGYEVISPTGNFNYSTSYMFSYGPFSHTGLKADVALEGGLSFMAGVFNPTDATEYNPSNDYAFGSQIGYEGGGLGVWVNGLFAEDFTQFDITAGYDISDKVYVGLNATTASDSFTGAAAYLQVATSESLKFGLRAEQFIDKGLGLFTIDESVFDVTLSANYTVGNLTIIPEVRMDAFSEDLLISETEMTSSLSSFVLAAVYGF